MDINEFLAKAKMLGWRYASPEGRILRYKDGLLYPISNKVINLNLEKGSDWITYDLKNAYLEILKYHD